MSVKQERIERAVKYGHTAFENSFNWGQSSLAGLLKEFKDDIGITDIEMNAMIKANSKTWGLGGCGETCGTVQGPIHFLGYVYGQDLTVDDFDAMATMKVINRVSSIPEFVERIKAHWGSVLCGSIHGQTMQKYYDLNDPVQIGEFINDGARDNCQIPVEYAIRTVLDMILNEDGTLK